MNGKNHGNQHSWLKNMEGGRAEVNYRKAYRISPLTHFRTVRVDLTD